MNKAMKYRLPALILVTAFLTTACTNASVRTAGKITSAMQDKEICILAGEPKDSASYTEVQPIVYGKGSYGKVTEVIPMLADQARVLNADAVINYAGSQRFGFWPWRFVRPVVRGVAIKWTDSQSVNCLEIGGNIY